MRRCSHGVQVGPLDDYGVPENERVYSTYCAECYREQTGQYPDEDTQGAYDWPNGHPASEEGEQG